MLWIFTIHVGCSPNRLFSRDVGGMYMCCWVYIVYTCTQESRQWSVGVPASAILVCEAHSMTFVHFCTWHSPKSVWPYIPYCSSLPRVHVRPSWQLGSLALMRANQPENYCLPGLLCAHLISFLRKKLLIPVHTVTQCSLQSLWHEKTELCGL